MYSIIPLITGPFFTVPEKSLHKIILNHKKNENVDQNLRFGFIKLYINITYIINYKNVIYIIINYKTR